jgi:hypothetical protein
MKFQFSENLKVDSLDKVPEDFRGLYVETDDGYKLNSDDPGVGSAVKAIVGLNKALVASRAEAQDAKSKAVDLGPLKDYGETPEDIAEAFNNKLEEASKTAKGKNDETVEAKIKATREAMADAHGKEKDQMNKRIEALTGQLYSRMVSAEATAALAEAGAINPKLVLPFIEQQVDVAEEDGEFQVRVIDPVKKQERFSGTTGSHMTIKELVQEMKADEQYEPLFKSEAPAGGGGPTTRRTAGRPDTREKMTSLQKISAGLDRNQASKK